MNNHIALLMAQINPTVGKIQANTQTIIAVIAAHQAQHDVIVFHVLDDAELNFPYDRLTRF